MAVYPDFILAVRPGMNEAERNAAADALLAAAEGLSLPVMETPMDEDEDEDNLVIHPDMLEEAGFLGLDYDMDLIYTVEKGRLKGYLGQLNEAEMWGIDCKIEISLGLRGIPKCPKREGTTMRISKRDRYNGSGCLDTTAYLAMKNIAREETAKSQKEEQ